MELFWNHNQYVIDEKVRVFHMSNAYQVYDENGNNIGAVQEILPGWHVVLRLLINKAMLPFKLCFLNTEGRPIAEIKRGFTFFLSKLTISDGEGNVIGYIKQKFAFFKPTFTLMDVNGNVYAEIKGDCKAWDFTITTTDGANAGAINKKWNGAMKEIFTTADKYHVFIDDNVTDTNKRIAIVATAISIDMILKESK